MCHHECTEKLNNLINNLNNEIKYAQTLISMLLVS